MSDQLLSDEDFCPYCDEVWEDCDCNEDGDICEFCGDWREDCECDAQMDDED